jgi:protoheme ferro-lyase
MFEWLRYWRFGNQYGYEVLFKTQEPKPAGKVGIILSELGMPEVYKADFYAKFMDHVFNYSLPFFLRRLVLADRGIALIDPSNPLARKPFVPQQLIDMNGSFVNHAGIPYVNCKFKWRTPGMKKNPYDHGYFLYTGDGRGGAPDVCQKTAAKVVGWYFGHLLPDKKVSWEYQCKRIYDETVSALRNEFPEVEFCHARYIYEESIQQAVEELLVKGCQTIIYQCFCNPVYSDFEDYGYALPMVHRLVKGRARVICADQLGNQPAMREAFIQILRDRLIEIPHHTSVLLILSRHGHPFGKETLDKRASEYRIPLEAGMRKALQEWGGKWKIVWSDDEFADEYWDPLNKKLSTYSTYCMAIDEGYDYAIEVPTDFIAENTDLMIMHAMKKFPAFTEYDSNAPIHYTDWEKPLLRTFKEGKTTGIYAGCPVGKYRKYVIEAAKTSLSDILKRV